MRVAFELFEAADLDAGFTEAKKQVAAIGALSNAFTSICNSKGDGSGKRIAGGIDGSITLDDHKVSEDMEGTGACPLSVTFPDVKTMNYDVEVKAASGTAQAAVESLFPGKTIKMFHNYRGAGNMEYEHEVPVPDGATSVTTMGSVLAVTSLFALAAW